MAGILISQSLYPELRKVGIQQPTLDKLNKDYLKHVGSLNVPGATAVVGMTIEHADDVVRWAIDATLGLPAMPESIISHVRIPDLVTDPNVLDPITVGSIRGLGPVFSSPAARGLVAAATISSRIQGGQLPPAVRVMKAATGDVGLQLSTAHLLRSQPVRPQEITAIEVGPATNVPLLLVDDRPDWEKHPELYSFPAGFPRTKQDMVLVVQTASLIEVFKAKTDAVSQKLSDGIRAQSPGWALPLADGIDWKNKDARFGYLNKCDQAMYAAETGSHQLFADALIGMSKEAGIFLAAIREYVFCHPKIFEDYWGGQLHEVMNQGYGYLDDYMAQQRSIVDRLKSKLSLLDFTQQQADEAARQAQQQQKEGICDKIGDIARDVGIVVVAVGVAILAFATGGKAHDPAPSSGSYGPVNPNDPGIPDPSSRPGQ